MTFKASKINRMYKLRRSQGEREYLCVSRPGLQIEPL